MIEWAIVGNLVIAYIDTKEKLIDLYRYFVIAGGALIIRLMFTFPLTIWLEGRLGSDALGLNPNKLGVYLAISAICAMYLGKYKKQKIYYLLVFIFTVTIILTGSRKAFFMLICSLSGLFYLNASNLSKKLKASFLVIIVLILSYILVMTVPTLYNIAGKRIEATIHFFISEGKGDYSTRLRLEMVGVGKELFKLRPILGYGIGSYSVISRYGCYSHNNYIELLVGLGIIGTSLYYSLYIYVIIQLYKVRNEIYGNPLLIMVLTLLIIEYGLVSYNSPVYQILIAVSLAASRVLIKLNKNIKEDN
ncbi:O-antigen ligase family protein [Garciella nitratireducens]|nr:O-antigen ligase family protein [Garciella nitratireducens]